MDYETQKVYIANRRKALTDELNFLAAIEGSIDNATSIQIASIAPLMAERDSLLSDKEALTSERDTLLKQVQTLTDATIISETPLTP